MPSDFKRIRYLRPKYSKKSYHVLMKLMQDGLALEISDVAGFRLHVINHYYKYGLRPTLDAFKVKRSTFYDWKILCERSGRRIISLVPHQTRPLHVRRMETDWRIIAFIKEMRKEHGNIGKSMLKPFVDAYAKELDYKMYNMCMGFLENLRHQKTEEAALKRKKEAELKRRKAEEEETKKAAIAKEKSDAALRSDALKKSVVPEMAQKFHSIIQTDAEYPLNREKSPMIYDGHMEVVVNAGWYTPYDSPTINTYDVIPIMGNTDGSITIGESTLSSRDARDPEKVEKAFEQGYQKPKHKECEFS